MQKLHAEILALQNQIEALKAERKQISIQKALPSDESPEALALAVRRQARENAENWAELKGIEDAIVLLESKLIQKQREFDKWQQRSPIELQVEAGREQAHIHAARINQLAQELAEEVKALKAIADEISPNYWQVYYKPFITGFKSISVPYVRSDGDVWTILNRIV